MKISVAIPIFNEEGSVGPLVEQLCSVLGKMGVSYEIIFVDDGSTDSSLQRLYKLSSCQQCVRVVHFEKNRGQTKALEEGLRQAQGEIVITLDGDLQSDPSEIPLLFNKMQEGYDLVCGWRYWREDTTMKKCISRLGNFLQRAFTGIRIHDAGCTFRAYTHAAVEGIVFQSKYDHTIVPCILYKIKKIRLAEVAIHGEKRSFDKSKYSYIQQACGVVIAFLRYAFCIASKKWPKTNLFW